MEDLQSTLQSILSDPEQMRRITAMAESLGLKPPEAAASPGGGFPGSGESAPPDPGREAAPSANPGMPDLSTLLGNMTAAGGTEDRVFAALRPSLSPAGLRKADRALRAAKISRLAARFFTRQRDGHV